MHNAFKWGLGAALTGIALYCAYQLYDRQFRLENIEVDWPAKDVPLQNGAEVQQLKQIFSQPFNYLDRGKQSYVFISKDGKHVIKFFDTRCLISGSFPLLFPIDEEQCKKKLKRMLKGYNVAEQYDKGHNGIVHMQLAPNPAFNQQITLYDRFGISHTIDLAKVPFVLQSTAIPLRERITALLSRGDVESAKKSLRMIIDMYVDGYRRGIYDRDHNFMYNTGFIAEEPIRIDVGRLQYSEAIMDEKVYMKDLEKIAIGRLGDWLHRHYPQYREELLDDSKMKLKEVSSSN